MPTFLIYAPPYNGGQRGGIVVMHYLCKLMKQMGYDAYLHPQTTRGDVMPGTQLAPPELRAADCVGIWPEQLNSPLDKNLCSVRWQMYFQLPQFEYSGWDRVVCYEPGYWPGADQLRVTMCNLAYWVPNPNATRTGAVGMQHKFPQVKLPECTLLDGSNPATKLHSFQTAEVFYSADPYSFNNVLAALCGARSVVVERPGLSKQQWLEQVRVGSFISYGESDVIEDQRTKAVEYVAMLKLEQIEQVRRFAESFA